MKRKQVVIPIFVIVLFYLACVQVAHAFEPNPDLLFRLDLAKKSTLNIGGKPGFRIVPGLAEHDDGVKYIQGPAAVVFEPVEGIIAIQFDFLGFISARQQDMIFIDSDRDEPFAVIRNVNSSGRINDDHVISVTSSKRNFERWKYIPNHWHQVELVLNTKKGQLVISTDGEKTYDRRTNVNQTRFTGIRFSEMPKIANLSVAVQPLPPETPAEKRAKAASEEMATIIGGLPAITASDVRKKLVMNYHLEKLDKAIWQEAFEATDDIINDIQTGLAQDIGREDIDQTWLRPVVQAENNPYLAPEMNRRWFADFIAKLDYDWPLPTKDVGAYNGLHYAYGSRSQASNANNWMLLYSHPQSPLKGESELLIRALRRIDAYMSDYFLHETVESNSYLNDFFALGPAFMGAVMIQKTYPEMLLPKQKEIWHAAARKTIANYRRRSYTGNYSNADLGAARIFINAGLLTGDREAVEHGIELAYSWEDNIYEDGASSYIGDQNESPGYHNACIQIAFDLFVMTGDPKLRDILAQVEYYPISITGANRAIEWFTAPSWKQAWYDVGNGAGNPVTYYLTGNHYYKAIMGEDLYESLDTPDIKLAMVYKSYPLVKLTVPDNCTVYDRNIQGVRMHCGPYSAAMNGRVIHSFAGKNTYVGLTIVEQKDDRRALSAALYGVNAFPVFAGEIGANNIIEESVSIALGRDFASLNAEYRLARRLAGPSTRPVDWRGRQSWIYLPQRMIGVIELTPEDAQRATGITMNIELGRGKFGAIDHSSIEKIADNEYRYGQLRILVHDTNFENVKKSDTPDGISADDHVRGPHSELHFTDEVNSQNWSTTERSYEGTYYAVVELKMADAKGCAKVKRIQGNEGFGLTVEMEGAKYTTVYNAGDSTVKVATAEFAENGKATLFADHHSFAASSRFAEPAPAPSEVAIPARQSALLVSGDASSLHRPGIVGWKNFIPYFGENMSEFGLRNTAEHEPER